MVSALSLYLVMLIVFFYFKKNKTDKITKPIKIKKLLIYIFIASLSFVCLYPIIVCIDSLLVKCGVRLSVLSYELTTRNYFISLISLVIAPAVCEELLFRGIIFNGLKKHGKTFAIILTTIMFSLFHMSLSQTAYPLLMGLLLGVIMYYEENIYYCIAVHMTNNFLSLTLSYFKINLTFNHWTYILLAIILVIVYSLIILFLALKNNKKTKLEKITRFDYSYLASSLSIMIALWLLINFI